MTIAAAAAGSIAVPAAGSIAVPAAVPVVQDDPVVPVAFASSDKTYPVHTEHGGPVNVRSGAGLGFSVVDHVSNGEKVTIHCTTIDGSGTVWDDISGHGRFVSDDYVKTGQSAPAAPACGAPTPAAPADPGPSPAAADHADAEPAPAAPSVKILVHEPDEGGCRRGGLYGGLLTLGCYFDKGLRWTAEPIVELTKPCVEGAVEHVLIDWVFVTAVGTEQWEITVPEAALGCVEGVLRDHGFHSDGGSGGSW